MTLKALKRKWPNFMAFKTKLFSISGKEEKQVNKPVRVLAVVCQMNQGGLENRLMDIIRNIDISRVTIDIFTYRNDKGYFDDEIVKLGGKIYYNAPLNVKNMVWYIAYFTEFLQKHPEYKIVHAYQDAWCTVFCKGAKRAGIPIRIAHSRTAANDHSIKTLLKNIIKRPVKRYATHYFAVSKLAGEWLFGKKAMKDGRVEIWPNAIDCKKYLFNDSARHAMRQELNINNEFVVMHVGNFTAAKNHEYLINIFYEFKKLQNNAILLFIGEGNRKKLIAKINRLHIKDVVIFLGSRNDVHKLLQAADVFVFPSKYEGLPGAVIEAQAAGLPCIISESISTEVCITPLVERVSLSKDPRVWGETIKKKVGIQRVNTYKYFEETGFDIHTLVRSLTEFYECEMAEL